MIFPRGWDFTHEFQMDALAGARDLEVLQQPLPILQQVAKTVNVEQAGLPAFLIPLDSGSESGQVRPPLE